jgi:hypothetical protein
MDELYKLLHGGLWHTTHPSRVLSIVATGEIMVEPDIEEQGRWGSHDHPSFVRKIGGISLFDFHNFDPEQYSISHPCSSWQYFVPHRRDWGGAVWLNIDREAVSNSFVSTDDIVERWDTTGNRAHNVMPRIEAAHLGNLSLSAVKSGFMTWNNGCEVRHFDLQSFNPKHYAQIMEEWRGTMEKGNVAYPCSR